jgi:undecaprenyl-diphosphatase
VAAVSDIPGSDVDFWQAIALGAVQGITEFFPISSSGHLVLFQAFFGLKEPQLAFDIFLHVGTLVSILIVFWKDIISLFGNRRLLFAIVTGSVPTFLIGFFFKDAAESMFAAPRLVGYMLIATGIFLIIASVYARRKPASNEPGVVTSLIIGVAQGAAVMPGISRSGATIGSGLLCGLEKEAAIKFSFLLAVPAILGASLLKIIKIGEALTGQGTGWFFAGAVTACVTGVFAIKILLRVVRNNRLYLFGIYCIVAGVLSVIFFRGM